MSPIVPNACRPYIERQLQLHFNRIEDWADNNGFKVLQSNTVCVHFCRRRGLHPDPYLVFHDNPIPVWHFTRFKTDICPSYQGPEEKVCQGFEFVACCFQYRLGWGSYSSFTTVQGPGLLKLDYGCFIYEAACKSSISLLYPIQNQGLRLSLEAFRTSPAQSLFVEANELPLHLRREKLALQFATKIAANPNNPVYDTMFNPWYVDLFARKPRVIPTFGICIKESLKELDLDPDIITKFEFPETPPWTYPTAIATSLFRMPRRIKRILRST